MLSIESFLLEGVVMGGEVVRESLDVGFVLMKLGSLSCSILGSEVIFGRKDLKSGSMVEGE